MTRTPAATCARDRALAIVTHLALFALSLLLCAATLALVAFVEAKLSG